MGVGVVVKECFSTKKRRGLTGTANDSAHQYGAAERHLYTLEGLPRESIFHQHPL